MTRANMAILVYIRAALATAAIISVFFIPTTGMIFPIVYLISFFIAVIFSLPVCCMLWISLKPVFSLNYSYSSCLVFFGFINAAIGALVMNSIFFINEVGSSNDELGLVGNGSCLLMACTGSYLSRNLLRRYYLELQSAKAGQPSVDLPTTSHTDTGSAGQAEAGWKIATGTQTNGSEFDPYPNSLN